MNEMDVQIYHAREKLAAEYNPQFTPEIIDKLLKHGADPFAEREVNWVHHNQDYLLGDLTSFRFELYRRKSERITPPVLCASFVLGRASQCKQNLLHSLQCEDYGAFIFWNDLSFGVRLPVVRVQQTEQMIKEGVTAQVLSVMKIRDMYVDKILDMDKEIAQVSKIRKYYEYLTGLLISDPSGHSVVTSAVEELRGKSAQAVLKVPDFYIPEFVSAGANLSEQLYKEFYPIAQKACLAPLGF